MSTATTTTTATAPKPKSLSPWAMTGLDLTDSAFSKAYHKEIEFDSKNEVQFDLEPERFNQWKIKIEEKAVTIYASNICSISSSLVGPSKIF